MLAGDLPAIIAHQLQSSGRHTFVAPPGLPAEWLGAGVSTGRSTNGLS